MFRGACILRRLFFPSPLPSSTGLIEGSLYEGLAVVPPCAEALLRLLGREVGRESAVDVEGTIGSVQGGK